MTMQEKNQEQQDFSGFNDQNKPAASMETDAKPSRLRELTEEQEKNLAEFFSKNRKSSYGEKYCMF